MNFTNKPKGLTRRIRKKIIQEIKQVLKMVPLVFLSNVLL